MALELPALDPQTLSPRTTSGYPEPVRARVTPREKRALAKARALTKIGVNLTTLPPGVESSMRHAHSHEDEMIFVLKGEVVLRTDGGEQTLTAGTCAGFAGGASDAHQLVNRSPAPATYLEISNKDADDTAVYPEVDLVYRKREDGSALFTRKDGTPY